MLPPSPRRTPRAELRRANSPADPARACASLHTPVAFATGADELGLPACTLDADGFHRVRSHAQPIGRRRLFDHCALRFDDGSRSSISSAAICSAIRAFAAIACSIACRSAVAALTAANTCCAPPRRRPRAFDLTLRGGYAAPRRRAPRRRRPARPTPAAPPHVGPRPRARRRLPRGQHPHSASMSAAVVASAAIRWRSKAICCCGRPVSSSLAWAASRAGGLTVGLDQLQPHPLERRLEARDVRRRYGLTLARVSGCVRAARWPAPAWRDSAGRTGLSPSDGAPPAAA